MNDSQLLSVAQVAELCAASKRTIWRLRDSGRMPAPVKLGAAVRWRYADIQAWIADGCKPVRRVGR